MFGENKNKINKSRLHTDGERRCSSQRHQRKYMKNEKQN